jgi:hypothetical protein
MQGLYGEMGNMDLGAAGKELKQAKRVLSTRQTDEDAVVLVDELELTQRFVKLFPESFFDRHLVIHKHQIDSTDDEEEGQDMVPMQVSALEHDVGNDAEHSQRDAFLNDLQLNEVEGSAVLDKTQTVGGDLTAVFKEGDAPRKDNDAYQRPVVRHTVLL